MKRFGYLAVLMLLLSSSAHAGSYSFTFRGQRVHVERPRHCFSRSCLSVTASGHHGTQQDDDADESATATSAAPQRPAPVPPVIVAPPPLPKVPGIESAASTPQSVPPLPPRAESLTQASSAENPPLTAQVAPAAAPPQATSEPDDTALGDWQSEGNKGLVRIEPCGSALCGYMVDAASNAKGETILINMKPKLKTELKSEMKAERATDWTGTIVSRASGSTYYATMALKQSNTLRVEACSVGRFFCSGNDWSRIATNPQALITSRQPTVQPPS